MEEPKCLMLVENQDSIIGLQHDEKARQIYIAAGHEEHGVLSF